MRRQPDTLTVSVDATGNPSRIIRQGKAYHVSQIIEEYRYRGKWWLLEKEEKRQYFKVVVKAAHTAQEGTWEIYREKGGGWVLSGVYD